MLMFPNIFLPRLNGFELMMAPYAVAHMKLAMVLKDTGYRFDSDERLRVFTNTLEKPGNSEAQLSLWEDPLAFESVSANAAKKILELILYLEILLIVGFHQIVVNGLLQ